MASPSLSSPYLPHINGLRAIAILGVLFYHLRADYCPAGYFGVDLFLVISGFLLFRSLLKPRAEQNFHYGSYLLKKAWRILPSWFVVTLAACVTALYLLPAIRLGDIFKTARYSAIFLADYHIDRSGDYFNVFSLQNPLLHFWYLSITEQLYILAPLLVIPLACRCSHRAALVLLGILAVLSLAYYTLCTSSGLIPETAKESLLTVLGSKTAYYHLVPRFWEITAGFAALLLPEWERLPKLRATLGLAGLAGILVSFYLYSTGSPATYLTVASSVLALRYASSGIGAWLLCSRPLQVLGTISFSLYLWHWPIMVYWKYCCMDNPGAWDEAGMVALSLALGTLNWWGIERMKAPSRPGWAGLLLRCSLLLLIPIVLVGSNKANKYARKKLELQPVHRRITLVANGVHETDPNVLRGLDGLPELGLKSPVLRIGPDILAPSFLLLGDSHAGHLYDEFHNACTAAGLRGVYFHNSVAPFWKLVHFPLPNDAACWNEQVALKLLDYLRQHPEIRCVLISLFWESRFTSMRGTNWETGESFGDGSERLAVTEPGIGEWCDKIRELGVEPVILGDTPTFDHPSPLDEWERYQQLRLPYPERKLTISQHNKTQSLSHRILRKLAEEGRARYIDLAEGMLINGAYPVQINGEFLYQDTNHLSPAGSKLAIAYLIPRLLEILSETKAPAPAPQRGQ